MKIPEITTERLVLRAPTSEDLPASFAMWSDPDVVKFIGGTPLTEPLTWRWILAYRGLWELLGFGYWTVEEKASPPRP